MQWPPGLLEWLKWFDFALNLDFGVIVSPECVADFKDPSSAFIMRHVAMGAVFPVMCLCICFVHALKRLLCGGSSRGTNIINPMVATWQIMFINCAKIVFRSFDCTQTSTGYKLDAAPSISCNPWSDRRYRLIFLTGLWVGLVYCLIIPLILFWYLARSDKSDVERVQSRFGWVFLRYHPRRWYYELVLLGQKATTAAITVFLGSTAMMLNSLLANLYLTVLSLRMHYYFKPFPAFHDDPKVLGFRVSDNLLEVFGILLQLVTLVGGMIFYYRNDNDCNVEGTCNNVCRYCFLGDIGSQKPVYRYPHELSGFAKNTVVMPGQTKEDVFWRLSAEPSGDPNYNNHCEDSSEPVVNRNECELFCKDGDPESGRYRGVNGKNTFGGICYYSGFRDAAETQEDAENTQYVESGLETAVTVVILALYGLFVYLLVVKSALTWRTHLAKQLGIGLVETDADDDDSTKYLSLEDAAARRRERAALVAIFERLDADQSHSLSIAELSKAMDHISEFTFAAIRSDEVTAALQALDEDKSGEVDLPEFLAWITNPDDELAQETAHILADVAAANVALSVAEVGDSVEYALTDGLRLHFIEEVLAARKLIAEEYNARKENFAVVGDDGGAEDEREDEIRAARLAYVQHRLFADADAKETDLVYGMNDALASDKLKEGPQFGLQALHRFSHFYARAAKLHQTDCAEGVSLVVIPFGVRGGDAIFLDEQGNPMPLTRVFELTEATPMQHEVDPQSSRIVVVNVGTFVEVLEEKSFIVNSTDDGTDSSTGHHQTLRRMRVVCRTTRAGIHIGGIEVGWITHKETLVQTDKPPLLARVYTVPLLMSAGQCIEQHVETDPGWYRVVRQTVRAEDTVGLKGSRSHLYPGEVVLVSDKELVNDADGKLSRIALRFNWRMRHSTGATIGDWEGVFNATSHAFLGILIAVVGIAASAVLWKEVRRCNTGTSVPANDFCLSGKFFDGKNFAQCLAHSECCEWNTGAQICESNRGNNVCDIHGGAAGVCQHIDELVLAAVVTMAVGLAIVANVHRLHTHSLMTMQNTPSSIRLSVGTFQVGAILAAGASFAISYSAEDLTLIGTSIAVGVSALYGVLKSHHTRRLTRAVLVLLFTMGIQSVHLGMYATNSHVWEHEGCVNSSAFAFLPEPAGISTPASCAQRCFEKSSSTLDHRYREASRLESNLQNKLGRRLQNVSNSNSASIAADQPGCVWTDSAALDDSPCLDYWYVDAGSYGACEALCLSEPTCSFIQSDVGFSERCELVRNCEPSTVPAVGGTGLLRSRDCLREGLCSDPMAVTFNPQATVNEGGCAYDCVAMHLAFRGGSSNGECEILDDDVGCIDQQCSSRLSNYVSRIIQGIPPVGFSPGTAPAISGNLGMKRYSVRLTASQGATLAIRHVVYSPERQAQADPLYCDGCKLLFLEYCTFANHTSGAIKVRGPLEPSTDSMLAGLMMKHVHIENNVGGPTSGQVVEVVAASATFLYCDFAADQGIVASGSRRGVPTTSSVAALKIVGTQFAGSSTGQTPTVILLDWQYGWSIVGVEPNAATFFEQRGTATLDEPMTCESASACGGASGICEDVSLPSSGRLTMAGIRCTSCPDGRSGLDCACSTAAMVVGSHCETTAPVVSALRGAGLVQWNPAESALETRFAIGSVLGQQRCWCGVDAAKQTVPEQMCVDERLESGPRTVQLTLKGNSQYEIATVAGTYTAAGTLNGRLRYIQAVDSLGDVYYSWNSPFQLAWNGAEWVLLDSSLEDEYLRYAQFGWAASRGLDRLAASAGDGEIHKTWWADFSVQLVADGMSESTYFEVYKLRGSVVVGDLRHRCFAYSTICRTSFVLGGSFALLAAVGLVASLFATSSGKRPTVKHSTGWAEAWVASGPRHGLMLLERVVDQAVIKQLNAAARVNATTVVTLGLPDQLLMLHAATGFVVSQPLLWLKSQWSKRRKTAHTQAHAHQSKQFKPHLYRDFAVLSIVGALVGNFAADSDCYSDSRGYNYCHSNDKEYMTVGVMIGAVAAVLETAWRSPMRRSSKAGWICGMAALLGALAARCIYSAPPLCAAHSDCDYIEGEPAFCSRDGICRPCAPMCECTEAAYESAECSTGYCFDELITNEIPQSSCAHIDMNHGDRRCRDHGQCYVDYQSHPPECKAMNLGDECLRLDIGSCSQDGACYVEWNSDPPICRSSSMEIANLQSYLCNRVGRQPGCTCLDILSAEGVECNSLARDLSAIVDGGDSSWSGGVDSTQGSMTIKRAGYGVNCPDIGRSWDDTSGLSDACDGSSFCSYAVDPSAIDPEYEANGGGVLADWVNGLGEWARGVCVKTYVAVYDCGCGEQYASSDGASRIEFDCARCTESSGTVEPTVADICPRVCHALAGGKSCFGGSHSDRADGPPEPEPEDESTDECGCREPFGWCSGSDPNGCSLECTTSEGECDERHSQPHYYDEYEPSCSFFTRGCEDCWDGIDGTCGMCAPGGRSERDETCTGSDADAKFNNLRWSGEFSTASRAMCIPLSMMVGATVGVVTIAFMTDLGGDVAAEKAGQGVHRSACSHCWHGTSGFARKLGISGLAASLLCATNAVATHAFGFGPVLFRLSAVERWVVGGYDGVEYRDESELKFIIFAFFVPICLMTALFYMVIRLWSHSGTLLTDMGLQQDGDDADADTDADTSSAIEEKQDVVGNAVVVDGEARQCVEAVALATHEMLQGRMLVPVIEYVVRAKTTVRAYPGITAPAVGSVGKREILVALEERVDQSGRLWVQFRNSSVTVDSKLGWVEVERPWTSNEADPSSKMPVKLGVPNDAEVGELPIPGSTLGFTFTEAPQPVFVMTRYDSAQNDDMHWRHAFENAAINGCDVVCATSMFAAAKVDGRLAGKSKNGSWYFEVHLNFNGIAQIGWATEEFEMPSDRAPFVGNDPFSWGFDGHSWAVWHDGEATAVKPFDATNMVRVLSPKKNKKDKKQQRLKVTIIAFAKPGIGSRHGKLEVEVGTTFDVHREVHNKVGTWVFVNCPSAWQEDDSDVSGRHEAWLRLPRTGKLSTRQVKKALGDVADLVDIKHWATDVTLERVSDADADAARSADSSKSRWKAGDVVACKLQIHERRASISWEWNGRSLPHVATTELHAGQQLRPVMSCIGGPVGRPTASFALSPRDMRHDLPEGYSSLMCQVARSSKTKEVVVVNSKAKQSGAKVTVNVPETAHPGSQVEVQLPSGHIALAFVPDKSKGNEFHAKFPAAPDVATAACERGSLFEVTIEKDWPAGSSQTIQIVDAGGKQVEVQILVPADATEGDKVRCALPLDPNTTVTIFPRTEPIVKLKPKHLVHPVGTKFHVLCEMATAEGDWLQIASESPSVDDVDASASSDPDGSAPVGEALGWVLVHCDKHEHEEKNLKRVVEPERQLVTNLLNGTGLLNIRQASSTSSKSLQKVSAGTVLEMVDNVAEGEGIVVGAAENGVWLRVRANEQIGWVQVMVPRADDSQAGQATDDDLAGVHVWNCMPQSTEIIDSVQRAAPPQFIEVDVPTVGAESTPAEPGSLVEVAVPLTGHKMNVVIPAKSAWRMKSDSGFSFVTRLPTPETSSQPTETRTLEQPDGSEEGSNADLVAPEELQKTLRVVDAQQNCVITAGDSGIGTKAAAVGGPASVRGCVRGGRGRWYFEVSVTNGEGSIGICSAHFHDRKKTRAQHGFEKLGTTASLGAKQDSALQKSREKKAVHEEDEIKTAKEHHEISAAKWAATEMAYAQPTYDVHMQKKSTWQEGEKFRTIVDHQVLEVAIPPNYNGGMVSFQVPNRYCALGEDPNSLNCAYKCVRKGGLVPLSHGMSSGFSTLLPHVTWQNPLLQSHKERQAGKAPGCKEGNGVPACVSKRAGNAAEGMLWKLAGWKSTDVVGVCIDTAQLAVCYTLNGVPVGSVTYDGYDAYESFYPAASIGAGDEMTFFFRECDLVHAPPLAGCKYFSVGQEAIDEEAAHESEPWETCTVTLPMDIDPAEGDGVLQRVPVKTDDGRVVMAVVPKDSKPGSTIEVKVPSVQVIGHFQVLVAAIVRQGVAITSPKVAGVAGRLRPGSVISIFEIRTVKAFSTLEGRQADVRRARTTAGWFSLVVDGEDVVVKAEAEDEAAEVQGLAEDLHSVEKSHTEQRRQEVRKEIADKHLQHAGIARAKIVGAASIAFTASAIEFHSKRRGDGDPQASIDEIHRVAQISDSVTRAGVQPEVAVLPRAADATLFEASSKITFSNPVAMSQTELDAEEQVFDNPMLSPSAMSDFETELGGDSSDEPVPEEGTGPVDIASAPHANAMLHLDSSHHHAEFDEFIGNASYTVDRS